MKRRFVLLALLLTVAGAAVAASAAPLAAIEVAITSPADGAHSLGGVVSVEITASAAAGVYGVQLNVDGVPTGHIVTAQTAPYRYVVPWDTGRYAVGSHTLTATATDWSQPFPPGGQLTSAPVAVDVGPAYPTVAIVSPQPWTYVRGTTTVQVDATSAVAPTTTRVTLDGTELVPTGTAPWTASWNTAPTADGTHVLAATVTDGRGKTASASATVTVDNTPPAAAVVAPAPGAYATASLPVRAQVSDAYGVASVQFAIDGRAAGGALTQPDAGAPYTYSGTLDLTGVTGGPHALTVTATDRAGNGTTTPPVAFAVGFSPPGVALFAPADWSFARAVVAVTASVTGGTPPIAVRLVVDGAPTAQSVATPPYTFQWDSTALRDGSHLLAASAVDGEARSATSASIHVTVDNTAPSGYVIAPAASQRLAGVATFQVHASDAYGVASVQFAVDGAAAGPALTAPDAGQLYTYSLGYDTSTLAPGGHTVSAAIVDRAGNRTTLPGVAITTGPMQYLPVLNFHEINPPDGYSIYDQTPAQADAELAWLKANGYQSVTLEQYRQWLAGQSIGVAKPILLTVDDGLKSERAWDPLLAKYGFKAVLFVITGWADNTTPGDADPNNMTWPEIRALATNGRWQIAFHGGLYGHGDSYGSGVRIGGQSYQASCPYFYSCLSGRRVGGKWTPESPAALKTAVTSEVDAGVAELRQKVPGASLDAFAAPFNDAGQWTNLYNDLAGQVQAWLPGFAASRFPIVFMQTNPVTYAQASGTVGSLFAFNRHFRFEVHTDTTVAQLAAELTDPAFAR